MNSSELEQKLIRKQQQLENSLDELNEELSPGQLLDEYYFKGQGLKGYLKQLKEDPMPGALIGAAIAMSSSGDRIHQAGGQLKSKVSNVEKKLKDSGTEIQDKLVETKNKVSSAAESSMNKVTQAGKAAKTKSADLLAEGKETLTQHPLMSIAIGFSLGTALGSLIPVSTLEQQTINAASKVIKNKSASVRSGPAQVS